MTLAIRKQLKQQSIPEVSFGPFRLLEALPWLVLAAAALRVIAFGGGAIALPATIAAHIAVLHAFLVVAQRSIELAGGQTSLGELGSGEQARLSLSVLWRIGVLMIAGALAMWAAGYPKLGPHLMSGLDGMAFDQFTDPGRFWSATIAALVLLMIVDAERNDGKISFQGAIAEFARRCLWIVPTVVGLGVVYLGLSLGQGFVRSAIWDFWQVSSSSQFTKNLIYFVFIFGFAMLRLWVTLLILTLGLKQSYIRD